MSRNAILVALGGLVAVAAIIAAVVFTRDDSSHSPASSSERVSIEIRANPTATIYIDGQKSGTTPMRLQFPKSSRQIAVKSEMVRELVRRGGSKRETYGETRTITLDSDQTLDFTMAKAKLENVEESGRED
jgi:hypothetical protein